MDGIVTVFSSYISCTHSNNKPDVVDMVVLVY